MSLIFPNVCPVCLNRPLEARRECCRQCAEWLQPLPLPRCPGCGGAVDGVLELCGECLQGRLPRHWHHAVSVYPFRGPVRQLVHRFKYHRHTCLARLFGKAMAENWRLHGDGWPDLIVPIPLHWLKLLVRGYNQADLLAGQVGRHLGLPVARILRRRHWTGQQAHMDFQKRQRNARDIFVCRNQAKVAGLHILAVDDVLTTGATLNAASDALGCAGAAKISVLTIARG